MDIKQQTKNVANQGRYGDSMLLHVNPAEVKGLAQAMPITVNPQTGQPEAFLPFLAPVLGSMAGTALLGAGTAAALSPALAAGIGAGLATYAQTGGSGSKALLSGLTAGFGANAANTAAATTAGTTAGTEAATQAATQGLDFAGQKAASQAANTAAQAAYQPQNTFSAIGDTFAGGFDQGAKSLATGLMSPSGMVAGTALGARGVINSQELFEEQMRQMEMDEEQRKRDMYANNPEVQLYSASGGMTQFNRGGDTDYSFESGRQVYAPAKTQYAINPNFMAGFAPETMYFRPDTINAPATTTRGGAQPTLGVDTYTGTRGGYDYEGSYDAEGNYTPGTAQGVQFAPQTSINPYGAYTGFAPQGLIQSAYTPNLELFAEKFAANEAFQNNKIIEDESNSTDTDSGNDDNTSIDDNSNFGGYNPEFGMDFQIMGGYDPRDYATINQDIMDYITSDTSGGSAGITNSGLSFSDQMIFGPQRLNDGGVTNVEVDKLPKGLQTMYNSGPKGKEGVEKIAAKTDKFDNGGMTNVDPLIQEVTMFILGESDNQQVVNQFVDKYGVEAFTQLREKILQSVVPNAQTSGLIEGVGNGGMDDDIMGTIGNKERIAVSQDEFIVPADVVSMLGDGSSDAGSKELYDMMDRVRQKKTGTTKQAPKLANAGGMLPA